MTTRVIILWRVDVTSLSTIRFLIEIKLALNAIKSLSQGSYDKQNLKDADGKTKIAV